MRRGIFPLGILSLILLQAGPAWAGGCAMCKTYVSEASDPMAGALNSGIVLLFSMPFLLVGALGLLAWSDRRKEAA